MRLKEITLVLLIVGGIVHESFAQVRNPGGSRGRYTTPKVRGHKAKIICPVFEASPYPSHGFGFKLGDPFALTYKFYPNKRFSFAVDVGRPASGLYNSYFRGQFSDYLSERPGAPEVAMYVAHKVKSDISGEIKALYHFDARKLTDGLQLYAGAGWQWRSTRLQYDFNFNPEPSHPDQDPFGGFEYHRRTMGPQVVAGIEYSYFTIPVAAFMEVEYFTDMQADPGEQRFEGGVGLRYVF